MKRRILSLVLVFSLLIGAAVRPQRADAVVATATVVAASAAAILTACGVTYWASSQTDAVDYLTGKIEDYLESIEETDTPEDWLGISATAGPFEVITGGVMSFSSGVANKLLDFVRWLQDDEGIESGGQNINVVDEDFAGQPLTKTSTSDSSVDRFAVSYVAASEGEYPDYGYRYSVSIDSTSTGNVYSATYGSGSIILLSSNSFSGTLYHGTANNIRGTYFYSRSSNGYQKITLSYAANVSSIPYNYYDTEEEALAALIDAVDNGLAGVRIIPSEFVNVPANIANDALFAVSPSVALAEGDSVDTAAETILEGITSEDGLSSTVEETPNTAWGWLYTLLVNIANAITSGVADIKQAVLGLADSIYSKFITVLQDIKTGISTIVNSITSAVSQLLSAIQALPTTIYSQFTQVLQDIKTGLQGIALDIYTDVINALTYVFVPSQAFIDSYVASLYATFDNHFSILSYPFSILGEFITRASGIGSPEPIFSWGNIFEPFSGKLLISAGSYNLNSALSNQTFAYMYQLYMIIVKGFMSFWFLTYLYNWFCDVFKMREADYPPPEVEDI